jgi:hypothetical protein
MMPTPATDRKPKVPSGHSQPDRAVARHRAIVAVMLGAPPAAVAADLGCDIATLMGWVRTHRLMLLKAARPAAGVGPGGSDDQAGHPEPVPARPAGKQRALGADRQVAPENSALVDAAYRRAQFDYSGRRVRPTVTH